MLRISFDEYLMTIAYVSAMRSEDPYRKVGAVAADKENRVIATSYNGLKSGFAPHPEFFSDRDGRQKYMLHAEINLCTHFRRNECYTVACTTMPCTSCCQALIAHGVQRILYSEPYDKSDTPEICRMYNIELIQIKKEDLQLNL